MKKIGLILLLVLGVLIVKAAWVNREALGWSSDDSGQDFSHEEDVNLPAPDVVFRGLDDDWIKLDKYRGEVVLVNFWATWCPPCREEIPTLIKLQENYGPQGFTVLGVAVDDEGEEGIRPFVQNERFSVDGVPTAMNYPILFGYKDVFDKFGGLEGIPSSFLISRDGRRVKHIGGPVNYGKVSKAIKGLL